MIDSVTLRRFGNVTIATAVSTLGDSAWYFWYLSGSYVGRTRTPCQQFYLRAGDQERLAVLDSLDSNFDPILNAPTDYPARRTITWQRTFSADIDHYRVEQQADGGDWTVLARVSDRGSAWEYSWTTARLTDLSDHVWRVIPVDSAGNDGTPISTTTAKIVRRPDAPNFTANFNAVGSTVTFGEA
jgi:hypothetical protein